MKDQQKDDQQKVSLIFYSEEEGKRKMIDKWGIEIGKKYTIGRSKKKVDISIQDIITISRIQCEIIFYDKDRIMIKDFDSSNGTFINKEKIEPNKEEYFSVKDIVSIGDEKNELIFEVPKEINNIEEEQKTYIYGFDEKKENKKNEENKNEKYFNEKNNKEINYKKNISEPDSKDSYYQKNFYDNYDKNYKKDKYEKEKDDNYKKK